MNIDWNNLTVVLTGAYGGLGRALATELDQRGARLVLTGRDQCRLEDLQATLQQPAVCLAGDISDPQTLTAVLHALHQQSSRQHMLINNAAMSQAGFLSQQTAEQLRTMVAVNLTTPMIWTQALLPWLKQAAQGFVVNVGSSFGGIGYPGFSGYCATKFGLRGFTQALSRELHNSTVSASYLAPRAMSTTINSAAVDDLNQQLGNQVDDPRDIAVQLLKSLEQQRQERFYGWPEKAFVKLNALWPGVVSKAIGKDHSTIQTILNNEVKS